MLILPAFIWQLVLDAVASSEDLEAVAYIDGVAMPAISVATTVSVPRAHRRPASFAVPAAEMSRAGRHLRRFRLQRLAQVHSHPAEWTGHSPWDDTNAYSQAAGALSIVLPHYARGAPSLDEAGIHIREEEGWREIVESERASVIRIVPAFVDNRGGSDGDAD